MPTKGAQLAAAAVLGFRFGGPLATRLLATAGVPALNADLTGAIAGAAAFLVAKRFIR